MSTTITKEMLATALQRLEALQVNESAPLENDQLRERAEEVAEAALQAIAICVKYVLASYGKSEIEGLGTFVLQDGAISFTPERDLLQYALLKQQDEASLQRALREAFINNLSLAHSVLPMIDFTGDWKINGPLELGPEERLLRAIFGEKIPDRFDQAASALLASIIRDLRSSGLVVELQDVLTNKASASTLVGGGRVRRLQTTDATATAEVGKTYLGRVVTVAQYIALVDILPHTRAWLSALDVSGPRGEGDLRDHLSEGDHLFVKVVSIEGDNIRVSQRGVTKAERATATNRETGVESDRTIDERSEERET